MNIQQGVTIIQELYFKKWEIKKEAENYLKKAISIYEKIFGQENEFTAISFNNLGTLFKEMGNIKEAEHYLKKSL